jgi:hypothetical protein
VITWCVFSSSLAQPPGRPPSLSSSFPPRATGNPAVCPSSTPVPAMLGCCCGNPWRSRFLARPVAARPRR